MIYIYNKNAKLKVVLNYTKEEFIENPTLFYPKWENTDYLSTTELQNPVVDGETIREMTRKEQIIILGNTSLLLEGEIVKDNTIVSIPIPSDSLYLRYTWDREKEVWTLNTTLEELQEKKSALILEHNSKRKEITSLEEEAEFFDVSESITKVKNELESIRKKINDLSEIIKEMSDEK